MYPSRWKVVRIIWWILEWFLNFFFRLNLKDDDETILMFESTSSRDLNALNPTRRGDARPTDEFL